MAVLAAAAPIISMVASVGGAAVGAAGAAGSNKFNAASAEWAAKQSEEDALFEETQQRRELRLRMGEANALGAASGVSIATGTPLLLELDRAKQAELQALHTRYQGTVKAAGYRGQAGLYESKTKYDLAGAALEGTSILTEWAGKPSGQGFFTKIGMV